MASVNMLNISLKALFAGFCAYIALWVVYILILSLNSPNYFISVTSVNATVFRIFNLLAAVIPGYIAGFIARRRPILHGVLAGVTVAVAVLLFLRNSSSFDWGLPFFLIGMSFVGGATAAWQLKRTPT